MRLPRWFSLLLFASAVSSDLTIDVLCLSNPSVFPVAAYDAIVQRIANSTLVAPSTTRSDSITGAEAMQRYFVGANVVLRRFELVHVTRVQTVVVGGDSMGSALSRLRMDLMRSTASSGVGVCGIDGIVDSATTSVASSDSQWFLNMPALVAPVALIGWIATLLSCCACWVCVCCLEDKSVRTVQQAVTVEKPPEPQRDPAQGVPLVPASPSQASGTGRKPLPAPSAPSAPRPMGRAGLGFNPPAQTHPPPPSPLIISAAVEFHPHPNSRHIELRIPSFR